MSVCDPETSVSVIVPARNAARWLAAALGSMQKQTFRNFELVVVVEGDSVDATADIVAAHAAADPRMRLMRNEGRGLVAALQTGLSCTHAPLVARMDADDVAHPERLSRQVAFLHARPDVALVGTQVQLIDANGQPLGKRTFFPTEPAELARSLVTRGCTIRHPTVLMRRTALDAVGGYRAAVEHAEDYDLWLRLAERFALANLPEVLLEYRVHPAQSSHGLNWRHRFARDCALIAAHARRRGEIDPLDGVATALDIDDPALACRIDLAPEIRRLQLAYHDARSVARSSEAPNAEQVSRLISAARNQLFGEGRNVRGRVLAIAARRALRAKRYPDALRCLISTFEILHLKALPALASMRLH